MGQEARGRARRARRGRRARKVSRDSRARRVDSVVAAARGPAARAGEGDPDDGGDEQVGALEEQPWSA
jgi:hypothetical protein